VEVVDVGFYSKDSWLFLFARVEVKSVKILTYCVKSVISSRYSIWINGRNYFKNKSFQ